MTRYVSKCASRNRQSGEDFGIAHGEKPERIRLLFSAQVAAYIREHRNGSLEMGVETSGHKELVRWVLSWVADVEVPGPGSQRDRVREKLREAVESATGQ